MITASLHRSPSSALVRGRAHNGAPTRPARLGHTAARCDGELSAGVLAQAIATLSPDIADEDEAAFIDNLLAQIEHLFLMGFLHVTHG